MKSSPTPCRAWGWSLNKYPYVRNKRILEFCRTVPCQSCGVSDGTVVAAHSNQSIHGKGMGIKASDQFVAAMCRACHYEIDQGRASFEGKLMIWNAAHERTKTLLKRAGLWPDEQP